MTAEPLIQLEGITKTFGSGAAAFQALKGVDLTINRGEFVAIMGPSGSGKSTLMHILGCLDSPTRGTIRLDGVMIHDASARELARKYYHQIKLYAENGKFDEVVFAVRKYGKESGLVWSELRPQIPKDLVE